MTKNLSDDYIAYRLTTGTGKLIDEDIEKTCDSCGQAMVIDPITEEYRCSVCGINC